MKTEIKPLHLFEGYGVELEYMLVHRQDLHVMPITDKLIYDEVGAYLSDVEFGDIAWSNELVLHVVELKTQGPAQGLQGLPQLFQEHVRKINQLLAKYDAMLLPTGAHPLMNPDTDTQLWPHEHNAVYETYNRIFGCKGHGWANLQSTHLNLPFANDGEFGKLHAAVRVLLPIIPALSASTPVLEAKVTGLHDTRLEVYRLNQKIIPSITGRVIPEAVFTQQDYEQEIFQRMYADIAPYDPEGILQEEFLNSRGAIARFDRNTIELRLLDIQECPVADVAVLQAIVATIKALISERWTSLQEQQSWHETELSEILLQVIREGQRASIVDPAYLRLFGYSSSASCTAKDLWKHIVEEVTPATDTPDTAAALHLILNKGSLSQRILQALGENPGEGRIRQVYQKLAECLQQGILFNPDEPC